MEEKKKKKYFQSPSGMHDVLPEDQPRHQLLEKKVEDIARFYRFERIETPILEETDLFMRGVGQSSDVVEKQMYTFRTKGGDSVTLRPEGTAAVVRSYIQHGMISLPQPVRLFYTGPFFRYERPQKGRLREFHQIGFEVFGETSPAVDAQLIQIAYAMLKEIGLNGLRVEVNSIGDSFCRPYYKKLLVNYFRNRAAGFCSDCKRRLKVNPLRVFDCKEEKCTQIRSQAPQIVDHLCQDCHSHFKALLEILDELEIPYELNPFLVRGLDYYTKTVFEIFFAKEFSKVKTEEKIEEEKKEGVAAAPTDSKTVEEQEVKNAPVPDALAAGGRYDNLVKFLGGKDSPAVGFAAGVERIVAHMKEENVALPKVQEPALFLAQLGDSAKKKSLRILEELRRAKISVAESIGKSSLKTQLHLADRLNAKFTIIIGQEEVLHNNVILREMESGSQETVPQDKLVEELKKRLREK